MHKPRWSGSLLTIPVLLTLIAVALALAFVRCDAAATPAVEHLAATDRAPDSAAARATSPLAEERQLVDVAPATTRTFEDRVDELIRLGRQTATLAERDDTDGAMASDRIARDRFSDLMAAFADAGERALSMLVGLSPDPESPDHYARRIVLQLILKTECERRDHDAVAVGDRSRIHAFVQAVLDVMPGHTVGAEVGEQTLANQRFLRAVHEPSVLGLVRLAADGEFSRTIATRLLLTLWDNLQQFGERSSDELSRLALLLLDDADSSQRTAACRQLLKDPRYRNLVLASIRERNDRSVGAEVAGIAAQELPVQEALAVLRELAPCLPRATNAYLLLGFRAPEAVADSYRTLLAANTNTDVRCDLITGVGMAKTPIGAEIAEFALHNDPAVEARLQAVFALTAQGGADRGERALMLAMDDPQVVRHPERLGALVLALQNLEATGDTNAVDRVAQRMRTLTLPESSRQELEAILARCLPGGAASAARSPRR